MKIICTQENLSTGLGVVSRVASKNVALPILNNVLLSVASGSVRLQTTNLEIAITTTIRAKVEADGAYTVQAKLLNDFIHLVQGQRITLEKTPAGLHVVSDETETTIKGLPAEDFPLPPATQAGTDIECDAASMEAALEDVVFAASNDESRPEISGVYIALHEKEVVLAATDSYRLSERRIRLPQAISAPRQAIIPTRAAQEVLRVLHGHSGSIEFHVDDQQVAWNIGDTQIISRVIEGRYPEYQEIIPTKHRTTATIQRQELLDAVKSASLFCQPGVNDISLQFLPEKKQVQLVSENSQTGAFKGSVTSDVHGEQLTIIFNYRYLLEGVQSLHGETVEFQLGDDQTSAILKGTDNGFYLIMPIRQ